MKWFHYIKKWFTILNLSFSMLGHSVTGFLVSRNSQVLLVTDRSERISIMDVTRLCLRSHSRYPRNYILKYYNHFHDRDWHLQIGLSSSTKENHHFGSKPILLTILFFLSATINSSIAQASTISENPKNNVSSSKTLSGSSFRIQSHPNNSYWNVIHDPNSSASEIQAANEKLFDHVVGTVNTLYYDNSGGANFYPKDFYDRWKVLKHFSYNGIEGLADLGISSSSTSPRNQNNPIVKNVRSGDVYIPQLFWMDHDSKNNIVIKMRKGHLQSQSSTTATWEIPQGFDVSNISLEGRENKLTSLLDSREGTVKGIKWLVSTLEDPYSIYLTREELEKELYERDDGFLGLGAIVDIPPTTSTSLTPKPLHTNRFLSLSSTRPSFLSISAVKNLPKVTAIAPDSPAERAGLVVGDRIVAVSDDKFLGLTRDQVIRRLSVYTGAENYFGYPEVTIAKPMFAVKQQTVSDEETIIHNIGKSESDELIGYKLSRVRLKTLSLEPFKPFELPSPSIEISSVSENFTRKTLDDANHNIYSLRGGDSIVHWQMLTSKASIFSKYYKYDYDAHDIDFSDASTNTLTTSQFSSSSLVDRVGYIRLTRFSRSSTAGFIKAVEELERRGAQSYIIDLRNNYGGIIQEAMLTASSLLRDPHMVLCYTINSRGGFTPHDVEEYIIDTRYPGYLLSSESPKVVLNQAKLDDPEFFSGDGWSPPSAFASLHEQRQTRRINPSSEKLRSHASLSPEERRQINAQKKIVILQNEGTASSAEVFLSSLKDNGRLVSTVGSKTYGKGLIQHTVPLPDGGGLRLTVAEYLTPSLQHVTKVGNARYDQKTGEFIGGGLDPDVYCDSRGIPGNVGADLCVGVAMDMLENSNAYDRDNI